MTQPQQHQGTMMHQPVGDFVYTCNAYHDEQEWMLADINTKTQVKKWTKNSEKALIFSTEQEVEEMIHLFSSLTGCHVGHIRVGY